MVRGHDVNATIGGVTGADKAVAGDGPRSRRLLYDLANT
jgi:hypothetical protein